MGRRDVAEAVLALLDDTVRKMNDEEVAHNRTYLLEDLITRLAEIAEKHGADASLFPNVEGSMHVRCAYDLLPPEEKP
jgi:hypothetical protein